LVQDENVTHGIGINGVLDQLVELDTTLGGPEIHDMVKPPGQRPVGSSVLDNRDAGTIARRAWGVDVVTTPADQA
jgi:hypothetical protein